MEKSHKPSTKQYQQNARTPKKNLRKQRPLLWKELLVALIRPHMEFVVQVWNPHLIGDIEKLELVQ